MNNVTISVVNTRRTCGRYLREMATNKNTGIITNVKLQRISLLVWHLQFEMEIEKA